MKFSVYVCTRVVLYKVLHLKNFIVGVMRSYKQLKYSKFIFFILKCATMLNGLQTVGGCLMSAILILELISSAISDCGVEHQLTFDTNRDSKAEVNSRF